MYQFNITAITISKILLLGYAVDLAIYHNTFLQSNWFVLLQLVLLGSVVLFINFQLLKITKKHNVISLFISIIIAVLIKLFTTGDPIFEAVKMITQSKQMTLSLIFGGISIILLETVSLELFSKNKRAKIRILDDFNDE